MCNLRKKKKKYIIYQDLFFSKSTVGLKTFVFIFFIFFLILYLFFVSNKVVFTLYICMKCCFLTYKHFFDNLFYRVRNFFSQYILKKKETKFE
jgi:hypothetical protein